MPCADAYQLPLKILKGPDTGVHTLAHYYIAPHVLMSYIYRAFPADFAHKILGSRTALDEFWAGVSSNDPRRVQLKADHPEYKKWCVPIVIHGDGLPCTKNHSLDTLSFESLLSKRSVEQHHSTLDFIFFMSGVFTQTMVSDEDEDTSKGLTKREMWKPLVHGLRALYYGKWPNPNPQGDEILGPPESDNFKRKCEDLAGGYKFVVWVNKGDMDFHINHYQQPGHWGSNHPCPACPCTRAEDSPMRWNDFGPQASWKRQVFRCMETYSAFCRMKQKQVHLIFSPLSKGGLGMHVMSQ